MASLATPLQLSRSYVSVVGDNLTFDVFMHSRLSACTDVGTQPITLDALGEDGAKSGYIATTATGNTSAVSPALHLVISTTAPVPSSDRPVRSPDLLWHYRRPNRHYYRPAAVSITALATGDGTWTLPSDLIVPALTDGAHDITLNITDAAGNTHPPQSNYQNRQSRPHHLLRANNLEVLVPASSPSPLASLGCVIRGDGAGAGAGPTTQRYVVSDD